MNTQEQTSKLVIAGHPQYETAIEYDRHAHMFAMRLNGETIGHAEWYHQAEIVLDELVAAIVASADPDGGGPSPDLAGDEGDECPPDFIICQACDTEPATDTINTYDIQTAQPIVLHFCATCAQIWGAVI